MKGVPVPSPYENVLNTTKVVVFMEVQPQSDLFIQIKINEECYKEVLSVIEKYMKHDGAGRFTVHTNDNHVYKFPEIIEFDDNQNSHEGGTNDIRRDSTGGK